MKRYYDDCRDIESFIECISKGILLMLNQYTDNNIELISISIYWFVRMFMDTIYSIITRYIDKEQLQKLKLDKQAFYYFPVSNGATFSEFYEVNGYAKLDVFDKKDSKVYCSVTVDKECFAYRELKELPVHMTFSEAFSSDLMYKYLIPQNVFSKVVNGDRTVLMTNFKDYLVGLG